MSKLKKMLAMTAVSIVLGIMFFAGMFLYLFEVNDAIAGLLLFLPALGAPILGWISEH